MKFSETIESKRLFVMLLLEFAFDCGLWTDGAGSWTLSDQGNNNHPQNDNIGSEL